MGVPSFFRWLSQKYERIIVDAVEECEIVDGQFIPPDTSQPNPNNIEFDHLYLDMNGIIHPCAHPEDKPPPASEEEMFAEIFKYIDRLFAIIRPRKLLYMGIDGVAPRAKMNQQRSRRFKAAKESAERARDEERLREEWRKEGYSVPPKPAKRFDSNVITPGTEFMAKLAENLRVYCQDRLSNDEGWKNVKVIFSDASCPGEGEHKIMEFIRLQRLQPGYDPNTHHVIYGLDADLIMLGLASHEARFSILREEVTFNKNAPRPERGDDGELRPQIKPFQLLHINVLREYLEEELHVSDLPFDWNFENVVDDFVFLCFFVGNDFLPHLPSLDIKEGAIDALMELYRRLLPSLGGYLTTGGKINLERAQLVISEVGKLEDAVFVRRREIQLSMQARDRARRAREQQQKQPRGNFDAELGRDAKRPRNDRPKNVTVAMLLKEQLKGEGEGEGAGEGPSATDGSTSGDAAAPLKQRPGMSFSDTIKELEKERGTVEEVVDNVQLGTEGWKGRYYNAKFSVDMQHGSDFHTTIRDNYIEGLQWVLSYYYAGCPSWTWFYKFHYAPFASDLVRVADVRLHFALGRPFRPFEQLLAVLPSASAHALPEPFGRLMTEKESPIKDFYPENFKEDMNGKRFKWQAVALLPFVVEERLIAAARSVEAALSPEEKRRNRYGPEIVYVRQSHVLAPEMILVRERADEARRGGKDPRRVMAKIEMGDNLFGSVGAYDECPPNGQRLKSLIPDFVPDVEVNRTQSAVFFLPQWQAHLTSLLPNATLLPKVCTHEDFFHMFREKERLNQRCVALGRGGRGRGGGGGGPGGGGRGGWAHRGGHDGNGMTPMQRMVQHGLGYHPGVPQHYQAPPNYQSQAPPNYQSQAPMMPGGYAPVHHHAHAPPPHGSYPPPPSGAYPPRGPRYHPYAGYHPRSSHGN